MTKQKKKYLSLINLGLSYHMHRTLSIFRCSYNSVSLVHLIPFWSIKKEKCLLLVPDLSKWQINNTLVYISGLFKTSF